MPLPFQAGDTKKRGTSLGSEDNFAQYDKDIRHKPYYDDDDDVKKGVNKDGYSHDHDERPAYSSGRRRNRQRSRDDSSSFDADVGDANRGRRSYGDEPKSPTRKSYGYDEDSKPYASVDVSRSEDEYSDASGRPRPKRRTKYSSRDASEEKELHYADLDFAQKQGGGRGGGGGVGGGRRGGGGQRRQDEEEGDPVQYASIRV